MVRLCTTIIIYHWNISPYLFRQWFFRHMSRYLSDYKYHGPRHLFRFQFLLNRDSRRYRHWILENVWRHHHLHRLIFLPSHWDGHLLEAIASSYLERNDLFLAFFRRKIDRYYPGQAVNFFWKSSNALSFFHSVSSISYIDKILVALFAFTKSIDQLGSSFSIHQLRFFIYQNLIWTFNGIQLRHKTILSILLDFAPIYIQTSLKFSIFSSK